MIDDLYQDGTDAVLADMVRRPPPAPAAAAPGALAGLPAALPQGMRAGAARAIAFGAEISGAFGSVLGSYPESMGVPLTAEQEAQAAAARKKLLADGPTYSNPAGDAFRQSAADWMPDPKTTGKAAQAVAGFSSFATEVAAGSVLAGPLMPAIVGGETGFDTADELRLKGVDLETRAKAGAVAAATNAAMVAAPMGAVTRLGAFAKGAAVGEAGVVGQTAGIQTILKHAGYDQISDQYDPFDPVSLAIGAVPGVLGASFHGGGAARGVPLVEAVRSIESSGKPAVDAAGNELLGPSTRHGTAKGDMQVLDSTALDPGHGIAPAKVVDGKIDPAERTRVGEQLIGKLAEKYGGNTDKAMAAYNWGEGNLDKLLAKNPEDWRTHLPAETQAYLAKGRDLLGERNIAAAVQADPSLVPAARVVQTADAIDASRLTVDGDLAGATAHDQAVQLAHDQLANGERVNVANAVPLERFDPARLSEAIARTDSIARDEAANAPLTDATIETRFASQLEDHDAAARAYAERPDSAGGKILNTDVARELSPDFLADRTRSAAVHEPASAFVKKLYADKLSKLSEGDEVVFTSGGAGAGKTTAINSVPALKELADGAKIVYDTNMNSFASAKTKIDQALAAGGDVQIVHVQRDPVEALVKGALPRAMRQEGEFGTGRTVPIAEHAKTHRGSAEVIQQVAEAYKDDPRVQVHVIDNTRGAGQAVVSDLGFVRNFDYTDLEGKLHEALETARSTGAISDAIYHGTADPSPQGLREALGSRDDAGNQRENGSDAGQVAAEPRAESATVEGAAPSAIEASMQARVDELVSRMPDMDVELPDGERTTLKVALAQIGEAFKTDSEDAKLAQVAAECFLRAV